MKDYGTAIAVLLGISLVGAVSIMIFEHSILTRLPQAFQGLAWLAILAVAGLAGWLMWRGVRSLR